jgi:hypothetical protein
LDALHAILSFLPSLSPFLPLIRVPAVRDLFLSSRLLSLLPVVEVSCALSSGDILMHLDAACLLALHAPHVAPLSRGFLPGCRPGNAFITLM